MSSIITKAEYVKEHIIHIEFSDGIKGEIDLSAHIKGKGGVFQALHDPEYFRNFKIYEHRDSIYWDSEADFAPEFLKELCEETAKKNQ